MSEQKGSYAHVGLPGLRELFAGGSKGMKEREIRALLHDGSEVIMNTGDKVLFQASTPGAMPLAVDADTIADDLLLTLEQANQQLTEKEEIIKREYDLKHEAYNNLTRCHETMADNAEEITRLRKALVVARWDIKQIAKYPDDKEYVMKFATIAFEQINSALGEGDKQ